MPRTKFLQHHYSVLARLVETHGKLSDGSLRALFIGATKLTVSRAHFNRMLNALSRRYKMKRKRLLSDRTKVERVKFSRQMLSCEWVIYETLFLDEKWWLQTSPRSIRCMHGADNAARFVNWLPSERECIKVMYLGGICYNKPPLFIRLSNNVDRVETLRALVEHVLPYVRQHNIKYIQWDRY